MYVDYDKLPIEELENFAYIEDNKLALSIYNKIPEAIEEYNRKNDADYNYEIYDAVRAVRWLYEEIEWVKYEDKERIRYVAVNEDFHPYQNHVEVRKERGSINWVVEGHFGEYGEDVEVQVIKDAKGFKDAQTKAVAVVALWIQQGSELSVS